MSLTQDNIAALLQQRQTEFIETRTTIESEVNRFLESIKKADEDVKKRCGYRESVTARELLPALWEDPFDKVKYASQLEQVNSYIASVSKIFDSINMEALKCLQEY